ncbi:phosphate ABC transporter, permease protein PstA [Idiomarina tyrosinivorans]|uniref:Phosphate transport system permease protein PstA n=1 Tax=Idiomarina tyrosinivorans TaxID=1445662 RepID=A0A432ZSE1_9GAMM|nr:phosphate ABC transporter permease PstA [Idiomarina tyrosinivorans]RUO80793.1 phosphate ABC transporter, permease protein PstA [Idiomarina tyrosinivorans]
MKNWFASGKPWIWMTAGSVSISLIAVLGLVMMIAWKGLSFFWPAQLHEMQVANTDGEVSTLIGEIYDSENIPLSRLSEAGITLEGYHEDRVTRLLMKIGNREYVPLDFTWIIKPLIKSDKTPDGLAKVERSKDGNFYGYVEDVLENGQSVVNDGNLRAVLAKRIARVQALNEQAHELQTDEIGSINYELNELRLTQRRLEMNNELTDAALAELEHKREQLHQRYQELEDKLFELRDRAKRDAVVIRDFRNKEVTLPMYEVIAITFPNDMNVLEKAGHFLAQIWGFVSEPPREANTEGGVFPAIFGTVFMVLLMSIIVTPFGVVAAIYLHEYAGKNAITKMIRIAVINLAGVPSIVYGVFGLGFFVYMVGGSIDQVFYPEALPSPTFGTPGVLWSAITLAILTLPVVIVSTEEGLSRIPSSVREGSLALGATKAETIWRIIVPMASPAIMTGLILAVARAAGEVAPLMLVGVVKSAPTLPVDGNFPYLHLDRKFMHLGFHIYDVGFQSPNVEAARPLVYATSFLLVTVIVGLNLTAIGVRNHLREKFRTLDQ